MKQQVCQRSASQWNGRNLRTRGGTEWITRLHGQWKMDKTTHHNIRKIIIIIFKNHKPRRQQHNKPALSPSKSRSITSILTPTHEIINTLLAYIPNMNHIKKDLGPKKGHHWQDVGFRSGYSELHATQKLNECYSKGKWINIRLSLRRFVLIPDGQELTDEEMEEVFGMRRSISEALIRKV